MARSRTTAATIKVAAQLREDAQAQVDRVEHAGQPGLDEIEQAIRSHDEQAVLAALQRARKALTDAAAT